MKTFIKPFCFAVLLPGLFFSLPLHARAADKNQVTVEKLLETENSWDGALYSPYPTDTPQLSVLKITIPPNSSLDWHEHLVPNAAYVQQGELTVEKRVSGETRTLHAGEVLPEMVNSAHRGYAGKDGVTLIVFYAGQKGIDLSRPVN